MTWLDNKQKNIIVLDADMIMSIYWQLLSSQYPRRYVAIATTNVKHLSILTEA